MTDWYTACDKAAAILTHTVPETYRSRTFSGILGDIKALPPEKALSLISRKKGLGTQYAYLYLTRGIDRGRGYQACAAEALSSVLRDTHADILMGNILDVGCAVGVTAGVLGIDRVTGFDLFPDLLRAAQLVDSFTGAHHMYSVADMTRFWPFTCVFDTVVCGLVCHHLKEQSDIVTFFSQANRVLKKDGWIIITLPSGAVSTAAQLISLVKALEHFGFLTERNLSGMVLSTDSSHSLFWMFVLIAQKVSEKIGQVFVSTLFGFPLYRTPVKREDKGVQAKLTLTRERQVKHKTFTMIDIDELKKKYKDYTLIYDNVADISTNMRMKRTKK